MDTPSLQRINQSFDPILLVSFASEQHQCSLVNTISGMNFNLKTMIGNEWLSQQPAEPYNIIVLLENPNNIQGGLTDALSHTKNLRMLAMINSDPTASKSRLVAHFQDFFTWPCSDFEINYRITRLFKSDCTTGQMDSCSIRQCISELGMIGQSESFMRTMSDMIEFSSSDAPVLIKGETGTGKELAARAIHQYSNRSQQPFVSINCGAIPDNLIENELFGHAKGAFTDAKDSQQGLVARAHGGTLFLDELDTLSPIAQVSLLRFLETQEYRPLGCNELKVSNARIVAATNANLDKLVEQGKFRRDLLFRLDVCGVTLPPLRERSGDIELLAQHFLQRYAEKYKRAPKTLHPGMIEWMREFKWDGNIRELDNLMHRLLLSSKSEQVYVSKPTPGQSASACNLVDGVPWSKISYKAAKADAMETFERSYLSWLMSETSGNLSLAARKTGQQRSSIRKLLQKHGIDKNSLISH